MKKKRGNGEVEDPRERVCRKRSWREKGQHPDHQGRGLQKKKQQKRGLGGLTGVSGKEGPSKKKESDKTLGKQSVF